ncbi:hypothetical protein PISL3812_00978 [Talaromyces islandicus]|uniref:Uncharacterized protein n=1 Tax=Talaromyces islandicus TaxID=28573 RepID=A0A0U1LKR4_TALIS|nr:hypothetical protein PISL3812_00978 [Talaromyces islandicus]
MSPRFKTATPASTKSSGIHSESDRGQSQDEEGEEEVFQLSEGDFGSHNTTSGPNEERQRQLYTAGRGGYNALKTFDGQVYSGMAVGSSHSWKYDQGVWNETKVEPDLWKVDYQATKRRARKAPKGSGVPVGAQYHWYIVAHQYVEKTDENTYETHLVGSKYKLSHKSASETSWSIPTVKGQREREISLLEDAKRRIQGLPPVLASEKVKERKKEKGQQTLDKLFAKRKGGNEDHHINKMAKMTHDK